MYDNFVQIEHYYIILCGLEKDRFNYFSIVSKYIYTVIYLLSLLSV